MPVAFAVQGFRDFIQRQTILKQQVPGITPDGCAFRVQLNPVSDATLKLFDILSCTCLNIEITIRRTPNITAFLSLRMKPTFYPYTE